MWFTYNCIWPGKVAENDAAQQALAFYSLQCLKKLEVRLSLIPRDTVQWGQSDIKGYFKANEGRNFYC